MDAKLMGWIAAALVLVAWSGHGAPEQANPKTAFQLVQEGNAELTPKVRDQVMHIESERSEHGLVPTTWRILYHDEDTAFDSRAVYFQDNRMEKVSKPFRPAQPFKGAESVIPARWRKVDSDKVIEIVSGRPEVKDLELRATRLWLKWEQGQPAWKVRLWARHYFEDRTVGIGDLYVSPSTGEVMLVDLDLKPLGKR